MVGFETEDFSVPDLTKLSIGLRPHLCILTWNVYFRAKTAYFAYPGPILRNSIGSYCVGMKIGNILT